MAELKKVQTFRIKPEIVRALEFFCLEKNRTKTDIVEKALDRYFRCQEESIYKLQEILDDED